MTAIEAAADEKAGVIGETDRGELFSGGIEDGGIEEDGILAEAAVAFEEMGAGPEGAFFSVITGSPFSPEDVAGELNYLIEALS